MISDGQTNRRTNRHRGLPLLHSSNDTNSRLNKNPVIAPKETGVLETRMHGAKNARSIVIVKSNHACLEFSHEAFFLNPGGAQLEKIGWKVYISAVKQEIS